MTDILSGFKSMVSANSDYSHVLNDFDGCGLDLDKAEIVHLDKRVIIRVPVNGSGKSVFVKIRLKNKQISDDPALIADTLSEFDRLKKVWDRSRGSLIEGTVSEPICCGWREPVIFLGECSGGDFECYLNCIILRHDRNNILNRVRLAGEWLGRYHTLFPYSVGKEEGAKLLAELERALSQNAETLTPHLESSLLQNTRDQILSRFNEYGKSIETGFIHNNYSLRNIIFDDDKIGVIDFEGVERGLFYYDIGTLLSEIEMKSRFPAYSRAMIISMKKEFLRGYSIALPVKEDLASAFIAFFMLSYLANTLRRKRSSPLENVNTGFKLFFLKNWLLNFCMNG